MRRCAALLAVLLLAACASHPPAPVEERGAWRPKPVVVEPQRYAVVRGDTLYSIAFRYGLDWRELAQWNHIPSPFLIHPGDQLVLAAATAAPAQTEPETSAVTGTPQQSSNKPANSSSSGRSKPVQSGPNENTARNGNTTTTPRSSGNGAAPPKTTASERPKDAARAVPPKAETSSKPAPTPAQTSSGTGNNTGVQWRWPAKGAVKKSFIANDTTRQGIDLAGASGDQVQAAADGVVVYSGTGLIGYGELIIIKHNDRLLSAYGHNRKRLVKEGDMVKSGQVISEMGENSSGEATLHFEIRVEGKPQNPLNYLPKR